MTTVLLQFNHGSIVVPGVVGTLLHSNQNKARISWYHALTASIIKTKNGYNCITIVEQWLAHSNSVIKTKKKKNVLTTV